MSDGKPKQENRFTIVLSPELRQRIKELADKTARTESGMVRRLILKGLESFDNGHWNGE